MRIGHTAVWKGKRVLVFTKNQKPFVAKFKDKTQNKILFFDHKPVKKEDLRTLSIYKGE